MTWVAFTGDVAFSKYFADVWRRKDLVHSTVVDFLRSADYTVPNVEAPITGGSIQSDRSLFGNIYSGVRR